MKSNRIEMMDMMMCMCSMCMPCRALKYGSSCIVSL